MAEEVTETKDERAARVKAEKEAEAAAKVKAAEEKAKAEASAASTDPVLTKVLERLDNLEGSNKRLEADNKKLKTENEKLTESLKENAELKSRLEAMDKQIESINSAQNLSDEEKRQIWLSQRSERLGAIRQTDVHGFHVHTAAGTPITTEKIKKERVDAGKTVSAS